MITLFAIVLAIVVLLVVLKSLLVQVFDRSKETSPSGFLQAGLSWLEENGYDVIKTPSDASYVGYVGAHTVRYKENAHFIARREGYEYAVIVSDTRPSEEEMCGRYFPMYMILGVKGLIFLDLSDESVHHVDFDVSRSRRYHIRQTVHRGMWFVGGIVFAIAWLHRT